MKTARKLRLLAAALIGISSWGAFAQPAVDDPWSGVWTAQGTMITVRVIRQDQHFFVEPVQSMGFIWKTGLGRIHDDTATIEVEYQGARGTVVVTLQEGGTAIASALNCLPETHLVCVISRGQQVRFLKMEAPR